MSRLFLLFVFVPLIELALLIRIGSWIGFWPTVAIVIGTAALGSSLAKTEGLSAFARFQEALAGKRPLANELIDGIIILASAVLLLTPGVITDVVGLMGLFPVTRPIIRKLIQNNFNVSVVGAGMKSQTTYRPNEKDQYDPVSADGQSPKRSVSTDGYETTMGGTPAQKPSYDKPDGANGDRRS